MIIDFCAHYISIPVGNMMSAAGKQPFPPESANPEERIRVMKKYGVDMQILSLTTPGLIGLKPKEAANICKAANTSIYELCGKYPEKFKGLAVISLLDVTSALEEVDRAIKDLGLSGVTVATNQGGVGLDSSDYIPFYNRVVKYDVPIFIHPTDWKSYPLIEGEKGYSLNIMIGWAFDTTQAICRLIFGKILERYSTLKIVTHHLGGFLPYSRVESYYEEPLKEKLGLKKPLSEYLKQIYGDTALCGMATKRKEILACGYALFGPHNIVFGTDYPFGPEKGEMNVKTNMEGVKNMDISEEEKNEIFEKNTKKLLKIK